MVWRSNHNCSSVKKPRLTLDLGSILSREKLISSAIIPPDRARNKSSLSFNVSLKVERMIVACWISTSAKGQSMSLYSDSLSALS